MSVFDAIQARRSVGLMKPERPPKESIIKMLQAGTYAPNHHEVEPWRFIVLAGEARQELGRLMEASLREKMTETESEKAQAALAKERSKPLRAPVIIVACSLKPSHPKVVDIENVEAVAAAVQNMLLVAEEEGLVTIWRSGAPSFDLKVKEYVGIEPEEHIVGLVYVGYPAVPKPERFPGPYQQKTEWRGWE